MKGQGVGVLHRTPRAQLWLQEATRTGTVSFGKGTQPTYVNPAGRKPGEYIPCSYSNPAFQFSNNASYCPDSNRNEIAQLWIHRSPFSLHKAGRRRMASGSGKQKLPNIGVYCKQMLFKQVFIFYIRDQQTIAHEKNPSYSLFLEIKFYQNTAKSIYL